MTADVSNRLNRWSILWLVLAMTVLLPTSSQAYVTAENFDTNWVPSLPQTSFTNGTNNATGWISENVRLYGSTYGYESASNAAVPRSTGGWTQSPTLTNGAGTLSFYVRGGTGTSTGIVEISTDDVTWRTNGAPHIVTGTSWQLQTNVINTNVTIKVRIRSLAGSWYWDTVSISGPPPIIGISNTTLTPARPADLDPVTVNTDIGVTGIKDSLAATNYWREWPATSWTAVAMPTNAQGGFSTTSSIPGKAIGSLVEYYINAACISDGTLYTTNSPVLSYVVRPQSGYTNMLITGQISTNMMIGANRSWQRALLLSNAVNTTFRFQAHSNGVATIWGETNQTSVTIPAYGTAEVNATNILLSGANTGAFVFSFDESSRAYTVMACDYANFDAWTNTAYHPYGNYTNEGWVVTGGTTSNDSSRALAGRSLVLNGLQGAATNTYLLSPQLSNGIGQISFWYRGWATNASPAARLDVQAAASPTATTWQTIASLSGIISTNYLFYSVGRSDRENQYVRFLNNADGTNSRICLDEVVIARPGAGIVASSVTNTPAAPTVMDTVSITATLTPVSGAGLTNVVLWYRMGSDGIFDSVSMSTTNGLLWQSDSAIPRAATGIVQYAIHCFYNGFQSESSSPQWIPAGGTNSPLQYVVADASDSRIETFDANWVPSLPQTSFTNGTNNATGWISENVRLYGSAYEYESASNAAVPRSTGGWTQSPTLTNGAGTLSFYVRGGGTGTSTGVVEITTDDVTWQTNGALHIITGSFWRLQTNSINTNVNIKVRIRSLAGSWYWDSIRVPYPSADVAITNVFINPGYPSQDAAVTVSCDITSVNAIFPAWAITPVLHYRKAGTSSFTPLPMTRVSGTLYSTTIPAFPRDTTIEYFVRCDFKGYYGSELDRRSPRFYPPGGSTAPASYLVRQFASSYSNVQAVVNSTSQYSRLLENGLWQTVVSVPADTNIFSVAFNGIAYGSGSGYATNPVVWGNSSNWQSAFPLSEYAGTGQTAFAINTDLLQGQQILLRFDEASGLYLAIPCVYQNFDSLANNSSYSLQLIGAATSAPSVKLEFEGWATNTARIRKETFDDIRWLDYTGAYVDGGIGGDDFFVIYGARINNTGGLNYPVETDPADIKGFRWVAQIADEGNPPFRGLEYIRYSYKALSGTSNLTMGVYFSPTSATHSANYYDLTQVDQWIPLTTNIAVTNTGFIHITNTLQTSTTYNVIFSQDTGTNSLLVDNIEMKEWYSVTVTNAGWIAAHAWIENGTNAGRRACRLESTRVNPAGSSQYVQTPLLSNGVKKCTINYSAGTNGNASFDLQVAYDTPSSWTNVGQVITNGVAPGSNCLASFTLLIPVTNAYLRVVNKTAAPGSLLLTEIQVDPNVQGETWKLNNIALSDNDTLRLYYETACYLNSNRTSDIDLGVERPDTNTYAYVRSPPLPFGVGEISFWYRNWAISPPASPARIVVQTCATASTNDLDWTTVGLITNVVNTNDYLYYRTSVYDTNSQFVRIYNDDVTISNAGRICLDDVLITAPMASTLSMSNLTVSPLIPVYSNTVDILVDVYHLFLAPSNIALLAIHGSATNYDGLASTSVSSIPMTCIASNLSVPGKWYRYKTTTPVPTNTIDTYVKYSARATFSGFHTEVTSPKTNRQFGVYPAWYDPMNAVHGTNQAYYIVYSCPTGTVWFNEINYMDGWDANTSWTNEYIEICGPSGVNLRDWTVQIQSDYASGGTVAVYRVTNNFALPPDTNGFGFWVLGDAAVSNVDMIFSHFYTNYMDSLSPYQQMPIAGGLVLRRKTGAYEDRVTYGQLVAPWDGFAHAGNTDDNYGQLGMTGTGSAKAAFLWSELAPYSAGGINTNQTLTGTGMTENNPPSIVIAMFRIDTNVWITCNTTNNWFPTPWYSTNLLTTNSWTNVSVFSRNIVATNCTINFAKPTNNTPYFYKVVATNSP